MMSLLRPRSRTKRRELGAWPRWVAPALACAVGSLLAPSPATAQTLTIGEVLSFLLTNRSIVTDDFPRDEAAASATRDAIGRALQIELATLPITSSSGGFTYRFNPALGTTERASGAFGPFFVERTLTSGRRQASLGFNVRYGQFERLDGNDLRDGSFVTTANTFVDEPEPFDQEALTLRLSTTTMTLFGTYGITDRLDVGVAVPLVWLELSGERVNTFRGQSSVQAFATASVVGLADMAVRTKVQVLGRGSSGVSLGGEVRLPTGHEDDLLGAGEAAFRALAIGSLEGSVLGLHGNVSYAVGGISNELDYAGGVTVAAAPRLTLVGEVYGRSIEDLGRLEPLALPHPSIRGVNTIRLAPEDASTRSAFAVAGFKWNIFSSWLLTGNVLFPLSDSGLRANVVPALAVDYAFGR
jgi:hypothetical protein